MELETENIGKSYEKYRIGIIGRVSKTIATGPLVTG